jgi:hypothetical protein
MNTVCRCLDCDRFKSVAGPGNVLFGGKKRKAAGVEGILRRPLDLAITSNQLPLLLPFDPVDPLSSLAFDEPVEFSSVRF